MTLNLTENKTLYLSRLLWLTLLVLLVLTAGRVLTYAAASRNIPNRIEIAKAAGNINKETINKNIQQHKDTAQELKKASLFNPLKKAPKPQLPVCTSILGDRAFVNGKFYSVGQEINGAKLLAVGANEITIMWEDKETKLIPFSVSNLTAEQKRAKPNQPKSGPQSGQPKGAVVVSSQPMRRPPDRGGEQRGGSRGPMGGMSSEQRQQMVEKYKRMSPDEQRRFRDEKIREFRNR